MERNLRFRQPESPGGQSTHPGKTASERITCGMTNRGFIAGLVAGAIVSFTLLAVGRQAAGQGEDRLPRNEVQRGLAIAPVRLNVRGLNRKFVALGSYIVNGQGGCNDCHTNPSYAKGGNPFEGQPERINTTNYLAGGQQFGPVVSRNITPNPQGLPAGLNFQEFLRLMRTGRDRSGELLQVMPWPVYGKMTDQDLRYVWEYLRAIPPAEPGA